MVDVLDEEAMVMKLAEDFHGKNNVMTKNSPTCLLGKPKMGETYDRVRIKGVVYNSEEYIRRTHLSTRENIFYSHQYGCFGRIQTISVNDDGTAVIVFNKFAKCRSVPKYLPDNFSLLSHYMNVCDEDTDLYQVPASAISCKAILMELAGESSVLLAIQAQMVEWH